MLKKTSSTHYSLLNKNALSSKMEKMIPYLKSQFVEIFGDRTISLHGEHRAEDVYAFSIVGHGVTGSDGAVRCVTNPCVHVTVSREAFPEIFQILANMYTHTNGRQSIRTLFDNAVNAADLPESMIDSISSKPSTRDPESNSIIFSTPGREVMKITPEGKYVIPEGISEDEATQTVAKSLQTFFNQTFALTRLTNDSGTVVYKDPDDRTFELYQKILGDEEQVHNFLDAVTRLSQITGE